MAYVYQGDDKLYNQQQGVQAQQGGGYGAQAQPGVGGLQKNVGSDALGGGGQARAPADFTKSQSLSGAGNAVIQRNQGAGGAVGQSLQQPGQKQLTGTLFGLGNEGNEYATAQRQGIKDSMPTYGADDISKVGSDANAYTKIESALNPNFKPIDQYQTKLNTRIDNPTTTGNYSSILQQQRGPTYSKGMANLDQTLFSRSPDRQQNLANQYNAMQGQVVDKLGQNKALTGTISGERDTEYGKLKNNLLGDLSGANASTLAGVNAKIPGMEQQRKTDEYNQLSGLAKKYGLNVNDIKSQDDRNSILAKFEQQNPQFARPQIGFNNALDPQSAQQLNALGKLLGNGQTYTTEQYNPQNLAIDEKDFRNYAGIGQAMGTENDPALQRMVNQGSMVAEPDAITSNRQMQANAARNEAIKKANKEAIDRRNSARSETNYEK
jgi:uncharacterized protein YicC (UPF0701 family)